MSRIRSVVAAGLILAGSAASALAQAGFGPLVSPAQVAEAQTASDALVLDIRAGRDAAGKTAFENGHIPGAVPAPYGRWRGPDNNPGQVPNDEALTALFRSIGIDGKRPVVVVHQGADETDFGAAARVYWTLKSAGVSQLAILNGGMNAWVKDGREVSRQPVAPRTSDYTVALSRKWLATRDEVRAVVDGKSNATLIDSRPEAFYKGETAHVAASRPGTLPHAKLFTHSRWFTSGPTAIDPASAQKLLADSGFKKDATLVSFCNTGHWAATNWFALSELAGAENVKLYPESMVDWSNAGLPMANVPGLMQNLWKQVKGWF